MTGRPKVETPPRPTPRRTSARTSAAAERRELVEVVARFTTAFGRWLDACAGGGLTYARLSVLEAIHCGGPTKMRDLAASLSLTPRHLTAVADALEADGLVKRTAHPTDRRATLLELTDAGLEAAEHALAPKVERIATLFDELPAAARRDLRRSLTALLDVMDRAPYPEG